MSESFLGSECVSCGACVQACPTATLTRKSVIEIGQPEHSVVTSAAPIAASAAPSRPRCAARKSVRMVPYKDGKAIAAIPASRRASPGAITTHKERILKPMIPRRDHRPLARSVVDEAFGFAAPKFKGIQEKYGRDAVGGITSSRLHQRRNLPACRS